MADLAGEAKLFEGDSEPLTIKAIDEKDVEPRVGRNGFVAFLALCPEGSRLRRVAPAALKVRQEGGRRR